MSATSSRTERSFLRSTAISSQPPTRDIQATQGSTPPPLIGPTCRRLESESLPSRQTGPRLSANSASPTPVPSWKRKPEALSRSWYFRLEPRAGFAEFVSQIKRDCRSAPNRGAPNQARPGQHTFERWFATAGLTGSMERSGRYVFCPCRSDFAHKMNQSRHSSPASGGPRPDSTSVELTPSPSAQCSRTRKQGRTLAGALSLARGSDRGPKQAPQ